MKTRKVSSFFRTVASFAIWCCLVFGGMSAPFAAINLNTATQAELETLPGIGAKKAQAIIAYRQANGDFNNVDDLEAVKGIGPKMLAKIKPNATVLGESRAIVNPARLSQKRSRKPLKKHRKAKPRSSKPMPIPQDLSTIGQ